MRPLLISVTLLISITYHYYYYYYYYYYYDYYYYYYYTTTTAAAAAAIRLRLRPKKHPNTIQLFLKVCAPFGCAQRDKEVGGFLASRSDDFFLLNPIFEILPI